jgi:hypothetical protein
VSHIYNLYRLQYKFLVAPNAYIVHLPHSPSGDIREFRRAKDYRVGCCGWVLSREGLMQVRYVQTCLDQLKAEFQADVEARIRSAQVSLQGGELLQT